MRLVGPVCDQLLGIGTRFLALAAASNAANWLRRWAGMARLASRCGAVLEQRPLF